MWNILLVSILFLATGGYCKKNVLLIISDDLRPQLNAWTGSEFPESVSPPMITPNLDALAEKSIVFTRAYCQYSVCNPSRTSMMTSRRPDTTKVYDLQNYWRDVGGNFTSLPQYFKENGYLSLGIGKIYHGGSPSGSTQDTISWSEDLYLPPDVWQRKNQSWLAVPPEVEIEEPLSDTLHAEYAMEALERIAPEALSDEVPFFMAVGFKKPHLPFTCPSRFFDLYPSESINFPANPYATENIPTIAKRNSNELGAYYDVQEANFTNMFNETLDSGLTLDLRRAYYACISYVDYLIGELVNKVEELGLSNNTIIAFVGDHGFQLGENTLWAKNTNFEQSTHVPFFIHIPGVTDSGIRTSAFAELVDLYPTLADAAGVDVPPLCPENSTDIAICTEGWSLMPVALNMSTGKVAAFHQVMTQRNFSYVGFTVRTDRYRYTEWPRITIPNEDLPDYIVNWEDNYGYELYDHTLDPEEHINRAYDQDYETELTELNRLLRAGWRSVIPAE